LAADTYGDPAGDIGRWLGQAPEQRERWHCHQHGGRRRQFQCAKRPWDGNYANVSEEAGIQAGAGGFDIKVAGNTGLTGAVIASTSDASKSKLTTGTLTFNDVHNNSHYDVDSKGLSAGGALGTPARRWVRFR